MPLQPNLVLIRDEANQEPQELPWNEENALFFHFDEDDQLRLEAGKTLWRVGACFYLEAAEDKPHA